MKLDQKQLEFVTDQLSNDESSTDEELHQHLMLEGGLDKETADQAIKDRTYWLCNIIINELWSPGARPAPYRPQP